MRSHNQMPTEGRGFVNWRSRRSLFYVPNYVCSSSCRRNLNYFFISLFESIRRKYFPLLLFLFFQFFKSYFRRKECKQQTLFLLFRSAVSVEPIIVFCRGMTQSRFIGRRFELIESLCFDRNYKINLLRAIRPRLLATMLETIVYYC